MPEVQGPWFTGAERGRHTRSAAPYVAVPGTPGRREVDLAEGNTSVAQNAAETEI